MDIEERSMLLRTEHSMNESVNFTLEDTYGEELEKLGLRKNLIVEFAYIRCELPEFNSNVQLIIVLLRKYVAGNTGILFR